jgi:5-methylcytosine-specific restriction protein B
MALEQFLSESLVGIGWRKIGDPRPLLADQSALKKAIAGEYPGESEASAAGVFRRFFDAIGIGNLAITPHGDTVHVGRILGSAQWDESKNPYPTYRRVEWLAEAPAESLIAPGQSMGGPLAVFQVSDPDIVRRVRMLVEANDSGHLVVGDVSIEPDDALARLARELLVPRVSLAEMAELLADKGQVIFYGPPGTGKTYIARKLAEHLAGDPGRVELVQFHPSFAYEDFVEGYRPREDGVGFELKPGPLKRLAERAAKDPENRHILVIDEINRGNVARVFGELYYLLDYRGEQIRLQYSPEKPFSLPRNLWIIATMNTADRSIGLLDAALRRRFYFFGFFPDTDPVKGLLRRWLERHHPGLAWVADRVDRANDQLRDRDAAIGPSYFMSHRDKLDERWVGIIWERSVLPYVEERLFGEPRERLDTFRLDALGRAASEQSAMGDAQADA